MATATTDAPRNPANVEGYGGGGDLIRNPIGIGSFRLVEWLPDATNFLDTFFGGGDDSLGKPFPELVEMLQKAGSTRDPARRQAIYDEANQFIHDHVPTVKGIQASPFSQKLFYPVSVEGNDSPCSGLAMVEVVILGRGLSNVLYAAAAIPIYAWLMRARSAEEEPPIQFRRRDRY